VIAPGGGPEANAKTLAPEFDKQGHAVSVIYTVAKEKANADWSSSVRVRFAPPKSAHYYASKLVGSYRAWPLRLRAWEQAMAVRRALREIDQEEPVDVVEVTEGFPVTVLARQWPVVVRAHGSDWTFRQFCGDGDRRNDQQIISGQRRQVLRARSTSALSAHLADHLGDTLQLRSSQVQVIPYGIDIDKFKPSSNGTGFGPPILLTVGRLERRKGVDVLLRAMPRVWQHFPDAQVHLVGGESGFRHADLLAMVPEDKQEQIVFPGFLNRDQLTTQYQYATLYIAPTQYETFGYTILEAMACGKPVISTRVGAVPDLVDDGQTGLLVSWDDSASLAAAILELLENPSVAEQMGHRGRARAEALFSLDAVVDRNLDLYRRALA